MRVNYIILFTMRCGRTRSEPLNHSVLTHSCSLCTNLLRVCIFTYALYVRPLGQQNNVHATAAGITRGGIDIIFRIATVMYFDNSPRRRRQKNGHFGYRRKYINTINPAHNDFFVDFAGIADTENLYISRP